METNLIVFWAGCCEGGCPVSYHDPSQKALGPDNWQMDLTVFLINSDVGRL